jgi:hypothetical protein
LFYISGKIAKLLSASNKIVGVPRASHAWKEYTEYVNEIVIDGLSNAICASTKYLTDQIRPGGYSSQRNAASFGSQAGARYGRLGFPKSRHCLMPLSDVHGRH